ncbi:MAG: hypothetical protein VR77_12425 [Flavobacteriales bacterium BRH_c54]|nr:MAG: hypothetical protein VR77_12425 [Flavobacteriales bacterium BRH_c54]
MKQITFITLAAILLVSCKKDNDSMPSPLPQPNYFTFSGQIGTNDNSTIVSNDNNLIICGNTGYNISILKVSKTGTLLWRTDFNAGISSSASGIVEISGDIFICGKTSKNNSITKSDILLIRANSLGDTIWTKTYGGVDADYGANIVATSDGNILISGRTESFGAGSFGDIYLIKVNTSGDTLWTASYPDQDQEVPFHLMETQNGEYLVTGTNEDNSQYKELYLLKVGTTGQQLWNKKIDPPTWKWGFSTIELVNGDFLTCGRHTVNGYSQVLLVKTDNIGNVIWEKEFGLNNLSEDGNSIKQNSDGTYTITGTSFDILTSQTDIILLKIDQNGNLLWSKKFGSPSNDSGVNLIKDNNNDNIITGNYNGNIFFTKTDNNGVFK